jgi:hypothetical protein
MPVAGKGGRPIGLPKTGGRKRGTPNKSTLDLAERLVVLGCDPIGVLAQVCMNKKSPLDARIRCAIELASYLYPKRRPVENVNPQESTCEMKTVVETAPLASTGSDNENRAET